MKKNVQYHGKF